MSLPFNEIKYNALMDRLEAVEVKLSNLKIENEEFRIDSEYYLKEYLKLDNIVSSLENKYIKNFSYVTDGIHESIIFDENSGINLISAQSPKQNIFDLSGNRHISKAQHEYNHRTALRKNDIIISTVGTIGNCAVVNENILPANSDRHVGIIRIEKQYKPRYVSTFMLSKYGLFQSYRHSTGNVQLNLFIYKIKNIKIPYISNNFQSVIEEKVFSAHNIEEQSKITYINAQNLLLSELGLADYTPTNESVSVKTFSDSFGSSGRLDAEYYQPKYDGMINKICKFKHDTLGNLVSIKKSIEPGSEYYGDAGVPFVRVSNLSKYEISEPDIKIPFNTVSNINELFPKKDTILLTKDGSVGIAYKLTEDMNCVTSGAILHLNVCNHTKILPDYLTLVLNSLIVQFQAERDSGGSIIQHWKPSEIEQVIIPILDIDIQQKIADKIQQSFVLRKKSAAMLEYAKQAVEMAIEHGEDIAMKWLEGKESE